MIPGTEEQTKPHSEQKEGNKDQSEVNEIEIENSRKGQ